MVDEIQMIPVKLPLDFSKHELFQLESGLQVLIISDISTTSKACLSVKVGSFDEPSNFKGLSHFLEHMLFVSSQKYPEENSFMKFVGSNAGYTNAYTADDRTVYYFSIANDAFWDSLDIFAQFFISADFKKDASEREIMAVHSEYLNSTKNDFWRFNSILKDDIKEGHKFRDFSAGNLETLQHDNIFDELKKLHSQKYDSKKMCLVIFNNGSLEDMKKKVLDIFAPIENKKVKSVPNFIGDKDYDNNNNNKETKLILNEIENLPENRSYIFKRTPLFLKYNVSDNRNYYNEEQTTKMGQDLDGNKSSKENSNLLFFIKCFPLLSRKDKLIITILISSQFKNNELKPLLILERFLCSLKPNSFLTIMENSGFSSSASFSVYEENEDFQILKYKLNITKKGLPNINFILTKFFEWLMILKNVQSEQLLNFCEETQKISQLGSNFETVSNSLDQIVGYSNNLQNYKRKNVLVAEKFMEEVSEKTITVFKSLVNEICKDIGKMFENISEFDSIRNTSKFDDFCYNKKGIEDGLGINKRINLNNENRNVENLEDFEIFESDNIKIYLGSNSLEHLYTKTGNKFYPLKYNNFYFGGFGFQTQFKVSFKDELKLNLSEEGEKGDKGNKNSSSITMESRNVSESVFEEYKLKVLYGGNSTSILFPIIPSSSYSSPYLKGSELNGNCYINNNNNNNNYYFHEEIKNKIFKTLKFPEKNLYSDIKESNFWNELNEDDVRNIELAKRVYSWFPQKPLKSFISDNNNNNNDNDNNDNDNNDNDVNISSKNEERKGMKSVGDKLEAFFCSDENYFLPKTFIYLRFNTHLQNKNSKNFILASILVLLLEKEISTKIFDESEVCYNFKFFLSKDGIELRIEGFNSRILDFFEKILKIIFGIFSANDNKINERFETVKESFEKDLISFYNKQPYEQIGTLMDYFLYKETFFHSELLDELINSKNGINFENLKEFHKEVFTTLNISLYVHRCKLNKDKCKKIVSKEKLSENYKNLSLEFVKDNNKTNDYNNVNNKFINKIESMIQFYKSKSISKSNNTINENFKIIKPLNIRNINSEILINKINKSEKVNDMNRLRLLENSEVENNTDKDTNKLVLLLFQFPSDLKYRILAQLFNNLISDHFFTKLQTDLMMGYVVFSSYQEMKTNNNINFVVQSPNFSTEEIKKEIKKFINEDVEKILEKVDNDKMEKTKNALIAQYKNPLLKMKNSVYLNWKEIKNQEFLFNRKQILISICEEIDKNDLNEFYSELKKSKMFWLVIDDIENKNEKEIIKEKEKLLKALGISY